MSNFIKVLAGVGLVVLAGLGIYDAKERNETNKQIGMSMKELKNATVNDISASMLEKAVQEAANEQTVTFMKAIKDSVISEARVKLNDEARKAVKEASEQIRKDVGDRISIEASMIDMTDLKRSARDKAEAKILEKFDGNLEDLLAKFNDNLSNVQKIYGGIADAITKTKEKDNGIKFTIG